MAIKSMEYEHNLLSSLLNANVGDQQTQIKDYLTGILGGGSKTSAMMRQQMRSAVTSEAERNRESLLGSIIASGMTGNASAGLYQLQRATGEALGDVELKSSAYEDQQKQQAIQMLLGLDEQAFRKALSYKQYITQAQLGARGLQEETRKLDESKKLNWGTLGGILGQGIGMFLGTSGGGSNPGVSGGFGG